ncbi:MAG TPA: hypothetical protein VIT92_16845 [Burkholderiaceae bacterium]
MEDSFHPTSDPSEVAPGWRRHRTLLSAFVVSQLILWGGFNCWLMMHEQFVFFHIDRYMRFAESAFVSLFILFLLLSLSPPVQNALRARARSRWFRIGLFSPLFAVTGAVSVLAAPVGWATVATRLAGDEVVALPAQVLAATVFSDLRRGCDQKGRLRMGDWVAEVCIADFGPRPVEAGQQLLLDGRRSRYGFYIESAVMQQK